MAKVDVTANRRLGNRFGIKVGVRTRGSFGLQSMTDQSIMTNGLSCTAASPTVIHQQLDEFVVDFMYTYNRVL